jgi:oligopeptide/dipeptide ABC transporter ATP-binding protein
MAVLLITHDLGVVHEFADRTAIMYLGRIVEIAPTAGLFAGPLHPYTQGLLASLPGKLPEERRLPSIPGTVPDLSAVPTGCPFADRCPLRRAAQERFRSGQAAEDTLAACDREDPPLHEYGPGHLAACHHRRAARERGGR